MNGDPLESLAAARAVVRGLEPHAVLYETRTLSQIAAESAAAVRLATRLLVWFATMALLLAADRRLRDDVVPRATAHA